ncbi:MAG TPA: RecQ family ATP-dependent DNA helicase [Lacibacter sp.]|nr:RecQ family ATP-dependent DNA helicase [Lacibacter sp.]HMO89838.1 RecQ family ATP-dependent DNA helicase [Lacibacter sp.]
MKLLAFFDIEVSPNNHSISDIGCIRSDQATFHKKDLPAFLHFVNPVDFLCGHNIVAFDLAFLQKQTGQPGFGLDRAIDTLMLSPLLFPKQPYHRLLKDDKLQTDEKNNPLNDAIKARDLIYDELSAFAALDDDFKKILYYLTGKVPGFAGFYQFLQFQPQLTVPEVESLIRQSFRQYICEQSDLSAFMQQSPVALAYALSIIHCNDRFSITPPWVLKNYPDVERIMHLLRNAPCISGCSYCNQAFDARKTLKDYFGYDGFRSFQGVPLQEQAVTAAIHHQSLLCIFPTGGGKSLTFQVPALISGNTAKALTVVISPLQSLMKDQVDNLEKKGITEAVTINGLLDPVERSKAIERVENGSATLLYISPESLRSVTIERLLLKRKIARFVIDEAHCFSAWGQDFRVDYLYIGDFIRQLQKLKELEDPIPVSCFTATAKQKVIEDIRNYFAEKLGMQLRLFRASGARTNLHYRVYHKDNEDDKYQQLRDIIEAKQCPTIVYVSRTRRAYQLASRLSEDGLKAKPYHGKMSKEEKTENQNAFMEGEVDIMVATSAFGMGVDKSDVGAVIHYEISDSLENYIQEAGRAGRDENLEADCYVLFNEEDLDKHFILLNQTKISSKEINQIWKAIKELTRTRQQVSNSALEIARKAGWDDNIQEVETRVVTAIAALEDAGYLKRGHNMPRVFASSIMTNTAQEAIFRIQASGKIPPDLKPAAERVIKKLFSSKSKRYATDEQAESRVDYISDQLGMAREKIIRVIELLREEKILANANDLTAFIRKKDSFNRSLAIADAHCKLEILLLSRLQETEAIYHLKELNEEALLQGIQDATPAKIKTLINFWSIKNWIKKHFAEGSRHHVHVAPVVALDELREKLEKRHQLVRLVTEYLHKKASETESDPAKEEVLVEFSVLELKQLADAGMSLFSSHVSLDDIEDTLFYLSRIESIKIEGGFLVAYNRLSIDRLEMNNRIQYKESDYEKLARFYAQKVQQIHIVGEYAKKMIRNYNEALQFVDDYFGLNYASFINKYFPGSRETEIRRTLTPEKFKKLFGELSVNQLEIINDLQHQYIVVAAGPGSGKTRVLVHKLASLLLTEDVKHEQLLMLTFSRAAASEFKQRLIKLIGNAAAYIEIKTFHSYCFDLLGRVGNLDDSNNVVLSAVEKMKAGEIETNRVTKTVLVIDEAQDMNSSEYALVKTLMEMNPDMRVILVGDDDQNIYGFRGANAQHMQELLTLPNAYKYELTENYRSKENIVDFANQWVNTIGQRMKSQPGFAVSKGNGVITVSQYHHDQLLVPVAEAIGRTDLSGTTCVLTRTNDEAMLLTGLLNKSGIAARLIQSNEGFNLKNLYELRMLDEWLLNADGTPVIQPETWAEAIKKVTLTLSRSSLLELVLAVAKRFDETNPKRKYKSDWTAFINESKLEDFTHIRTDMIYVSTIHKAKGKEFDNVFLMLPGYIPKDDEDKRAVYVAVTRAKNNLYVHYNQHWLNSIITENLQHLRDTVQYPPPQHMAVSLSLKDVQLGYFEYVQRRIVKLNSGDTLSLLPDGLGNKQEELVLKFSASLKQKLDGFAAHGYKLSAARVAFMVYWNNPNTQIESVILLPELLLEKILLP